MAADTAVKRYSAINIASPWRGILPIPDGAIAQGDRQVVFHQYSGILAGVAATIGILRVAKMAGATRMFSKQAGGTRITARKLAS